MGQAVAATGRRASITRQVIIDAAIALAGNNRTIASLSLREVARQAEIAPNSFYRHFRDTDELAIAVIEVAGGSLRQIIGDARGMISEEQSVVRSSVQAFMNQLNNDQSYLPILLREGQVGPEAFQIAIKNQLNYFANELQSDITRFSEENAAPKIAPNLVAQAITRLVFAMGSDAINMNKEQREQWVEDVVVMVKMILRGAQAD